jgi:hypothetical protein
MTYVKERERLTIEKLSADCIDVRELWKRRNSARL